MATAIQYPAFDAKNNARQRSAGGRDLAARFRGGDLSRAVALHPGLDSKNGTPPIPKDAPPSFIAGAGWQDKIHAVWAE